MGKHPKGVGVAARLLCSPSDGALIPACGALSNLEEKDHDQSVLNVAIMCHAAATG